VSLAFASLVTWTIFFGKTMQLSRAQGRLRNALVLIGNARTLAEAQSDKLSSVSVRRRPHALSAAEYL
jgi:biopolymer transport protein ExbB/TolQ